MCENTLHLSSGSIIFWLGLDLMAEAVVASAFYVVKRLRTEAGHE